MKTAEQIQADFEEAARNVGELRALAGKLEKLADQDLEGILLFTGKAWTGETSLLYLDKGRKLERRIKERVSHLYRTADAMESAAQRAFDIEQRAARLFSSKKE